MENNRRKRVLKNEKNTKKSFKIKKIEKYKKEIKIISALLILLALFLIILPGQKGHVLRRYKYSTNALLTSKKYNIKLVRKRAKYNETIKEISKDDKKLANRINMNTVELIDNNEKIVKTYFEKDKVFVEEKTSRKNNNIKELMFFPIIDNKKSKIKNMKLKSDTYNDIKVHKLTYEINGLNYTLYISKENYFPVAYEINQNKNKIVYEYKIDDKNFDDKNFEYLKNLNYSKVNDKNKNKYLEKKDQQDFVGIN